MLPELTESQMGQALAIARGDVPAQLRFHAPYLHPLDIQPASGYSRVDRLEVVTLFRRLELIGVEHARINDSFGRGGYRDVREALQPWFGKMSIVIHVQILPTLRFNPQLPAIDVQRAALIRSRVGAGVDAAERVQLVRGWRAGNRDSVQTRGGQC
jgi:hypothetical protein